MQSGEKPGPVLVHFILGDARSESEIETRDGQGIFSTMTRGKSMIKVRDFIESGATVKRDLVDSAK